MEFKTYSNFEIEQRTGEYGTLMQSHLLIVVAPKSRDVRPIPNVHRVDQLNLDFDDVEDIKMDAKCFDSNLAKEILTKVDELGSTISTIIVSSEAGLSRCSAIAAALSKIINYSDDLIYSSKVPNMLVYLTILEEYFLAESVYTQYNTLSRLREISAKQNLNINDFKALQYRMENRRG